MTHPSTIAQRFLSNPNQLGVVAVGFNGGQVSSLIRGPGPPALQLDHINNTRRGQTRLTNQCKLGVEAAPLALIENGLLNQLRDDLSYELHYDDIIHHYENITPLDDPAHRGMKKPRAASAVTQELSKQVYNHAKDGKMVLTLGGDHSIAVGTISGTAKAIRERLGREMAVIWVDAHADINTPEMSESGNIHGMPMAFLTGLAKGDKMDIFGWMGDQPAVNTRKLVYIGLRDVDREEKKLLREHNIKAFSMHDIDRYAPLFPLVSDVVLTSQDTVSVVWLRWPSLISATISPFICHSMSMRWIRNGLLAPVLRSEGV